MSNTMTDLEDPTAGVVHSQFDAKKAAAAAGVDYEALMVNAQLADEQQHNATFKESVHMYKRAILWSMALSAALIMEGYDVVVIASFYGQSNFLARFGTMYQGKYIIPAEWQSALGNGSSAGGIIGLLLNGILVERFGARYVMMGALCTLCCFLFLFVFAQNLGTLVAAEVCCGLSWGCFQTLTTAYAADICPIHLRGYLTSYINCCWGFGILLSSGVVRATLNIQSDWSWRLPFIIQFVWIPPLLAICFFAPESPWWLVRAGRFDDAEASLKRLANPELWTDEMSKNQLMYMIHTTELERQQTEGASFIDCFRGIDRRRTEIAMMAFAMQLLSGQNLIGQGIQFLEDAGLSEVAAFDLNMVLNSMFIIGTMGSWVLMLLGLGRRTLYFWGMAAMAVVLYIVGGLGFVGSTQTDKAAGGLLIVLNFIYNATLGPICYTLISEVGSTRLRQKTVALARIAYQIMNIVCGIIVPRMLSPAAWNWGQKCGLFWGGSATLCCVYIWFRVPETRGRNWHELDELFAAGTSAWRFSKTQVDEFSHDQEYVINAPSTEKEKEDIEISHHA